MKIEDQNTQAYEEHAVLPEQLDQLMTVTKPGGWMALLAIIFLLVTALVWGIMGEIPTKAHVNGILIKSGGVHNIVHTSGGRITDITVVVGDKVKKGQVVARIEQYGLARKINALKEKSSEIENSLKWVENASQRQELERLKKEIAGLQDEMKFTSSIVSQCDGRVLEIKVNKGDILEPGKSVASIERSGQTFKELEALLYVPAELGNQIRQGMEVEISPSSTKKEEYGYMKAKVTSISEYPVTAEGMMRVLGNDELVKKFSGHSALVELRAELEAKSDTVSGYKWTSTKGPDFKINSGVLCIAEITLSKEKPLKAILQGKSGGSSH